MEEQSSRHRTFGRPAVDELKRKSVRGGGVADGTQGVKLMLQTGMVMLLARLLPRARRESWEGRTLGQPTVYSSAEKAFPC